MMRANVFRIVMIDIIMRRAFVLFFGGLVKMRVRMGMTVRRFHQRAQLRRLEHKCQGDEQRQQGGPQMWSRAIRGTCLMSTHGGD